MISSLSSSKVLLVSFPWRNRLNPNPHSRVCFDSSTPIAQSIDVAKEVDPFTVSYLINSCGLSSESAKLASKYVNKLNPSNPDSVLDCLKSYGFSDADIKKLVRKFPRVLNMKLEVNLKPKMKFFLSIGVKEDDLVKLICRNPNLLSCSLDKKIIPCYEFFKRILVDDELVVKPLERNSWVWKKNLEKNYVANIELLKTVGVPESNFQYFIINSSQWFSIDSAKFSERVNRVISMRFDPSKYSFLIAITCLPAETSTWERKAQVCRSWGWSDSDISLAFWKNPHVMATSMEKFTNVMDFLVKKMGWDPSDVAAAARVLSCSFKKNIIPRCSVVRVLMLKGLIKKEELTLYSVIKSPKKWFMDRYVFRYLEQVPELSDILEGKVDILELGYEFEEKLDTKLEKLAS